MATRSESYRPPPQAVVRTNDNMRVCVETVVGDELIDVRCVFQGGAAADPVGKEGLSGLMGSVLRAGTRRMTYDIVDKAIDGMGATLGIDAHYDSVVVAGTVIRRNLQPYLELVSELLTEPAFRSSDVERLRRESLAYVEELADRDRVLAARAVRRVLFGAHPYARTVVGTKASLKRIRRTDLIERHEALFHVNNALIGFAGDLGADAATELAERHFGCLPKGRARARRLAAPRTPQKRQVLVVDLPSREQALAFVATVGTRRAEEDNFALHVGNAAFGGTFSSRLTRAVRVERGWSYTCYSQLQPDQQRGMWVMVTHPQAQHVAECIQLELDLYRTWRETGLASAETRHAKAYVGRSHAFDIDTASKRLSCRLDTELHNLPESWYTHYTRHVNRLGRGEINKAISTHLPVTPPAIVVVGSAKQVVGPLEAAFGSGRVEVTDAATLLA